MHENICVNGRRISANHYPCAVTGTTPTNNNIDDNCQVILLYTLWL